MIVRRNRIIICTIRNGYTKTGGLRPKTTCDLYHLWLRHCTCSANPLRSATYSQPAVIGLCIQSDRPTRCLRWLTAAKIWACLEAFVEKCHFFVTTTPIDIKPSRSPAHRRHASACQISLSYDAAFRRSLATEKINKHSNKIMKD